MTPEDLDFIANKIAAKLRTDHEFQIDPEKHYQHHLFVSRWKSTWDRAVDTTGRIMLTGAILILIGAGLFFLKIFGGKIL